METRIKYINKNKKKMNRKFENIRSKIKFKHCTLRN